MPLRERFTWNDDDIEWLPQNSGTTSSLEDEQSTILWGLSQVASAEDLARWLPIARSFLDDYPQDEAVVQALEDATNRVRNEG